MKPYHRVLWPLYVVWFLRWLLFVAPIWMLFYQSRGLDLAGIGLVSSAGYATMFALEYPTGIFADRWGHKKSVLCALILLTLGYIIELNAYSLRMFIIGGGLCLGASYAFASGAWESLVYETLKKKRLERYNSKSKGLFDAIGHYAAIFSALAAHRTSSLTLNAPRRK